MGLWAIEYQLANAAPEYVFEWLKSNVAKEPNWDNGRNKLENSLLARNDKLVNLGLALYGEIPSVGFKLFQSDDSVIRRATLSGRSVRSILGRSWVLNDDVIPVLLEEEKQRKESESENDNSDDGEITLLHELLGNSFVPSELLTAIYEKTEPFSDVDDDLWIDLVSMTVRNERLSTPYSSVWMDGFDQYKYETVFSAAWRLFRVFPVNRRAASILSSLSDRLVSDSPNDVEALEVADRWRPDDGKEQGAYSLARASLVKLISNHSREFKDLKNHEDLALRQGYYSSLSWPEPGDVADGFERDGKNFLDSALYNNAFYAREETRSALRTACWDAPDKHSRMDYPNYFNVREKQLSAEYPEWFEDSWSGELPFEQIEDPEERREKRLEYLNTQVAELRKTIIGYKEEYQEASEFGEDSTLNELRLELQLIGELLGKLYQKSSFSWTWLAAGIALGFILGRY